MTPETARRLISTARVARLATADRSGRPHLVPIVFAGDGGVLYHAVDHKAKRTAALRRLANLADNPAASMLVDNYDDDWNELWWARADGTARVLPPDHPEASRAVELLQRRYAPYRDRPPSGVVIAVDVERWSGWAAFEPAV